MTMSEMQALQDERDSYNLALIFLNEALRRTEDLQKSTTKAGYPDVDNRISRIKSAICRFEQHVSDMALYYHE